MSRQIRSLAAKLGIPESTTEDIMKPVIEKIHLVLDSPDLPKEAKERFVKKIGSTIDELSRLSPDEIRNFMLRQRSIA
jgi:pyrroline-5-carboxylate reductase